MMIKGKTFPWDKSASWGALGQVDGMQNWDKKFIMEWKELSEKAINVQRMSAGATKTKLVKDVINKRDNIIYRARSHGK
jgi:hypothetical protein